jgi:hypothetical protein
MLKALAECMIEKYSRAESKYWIQLTDSEKPTAKLSGIINERA